MTRPIQLGLAFALAAWAGACSPKTDTVPPDGGGAKACPEDAKVCDDGSTVSRSGPDCEFPACPGEGEDEGEDAGEPAADDAADPEPASGEDAE